jgi:D-alanyl-D-alanine carboxypeptidase/D-alanyl-D-alanine-endopeptidase (penicillin-binding protein 4)
MGGGCSVVPIWQGGRDGRATVLVHGSWGTACGTRTVSFVPPPDSGIAARALPAMWAATGGVLRGRVVSAPVVPGVSPIPLGPDGEPVQPLSFDRSKPLTELVRDINKVSDNVGARNLMLSLSPGFPARPATLSGAQRIMTLWLRDQGLADGDVEVENGSGLSHSERAKPRALVQLLRKAWRAEQAQAFFDSLPIAGVDGTMKGRLIGSRAAGQAYLKTGTLNDTRALAGYVHGASGKMYAVALMVNGADPAAGRPALDAMVAWLAKNG